MKVAIATLTEGARALAEKIVAEDSSFQLLPQSPSIAATLEENWSRFDGFVCIMAAGIVVRAIAPLLKSKQKDPCVIVMDEKGRHAVSLLSGHLGGGNRLARILAGMTGGEAVITTASDTLDLVALDLWAEKQGLAVADSTMLTKASSMLVNRGSLKLYSDIDVESLPRGLVSTKDVDDAEIIVTNTLMQSDTPIFYPQNLVVGVGCNRGTPTAEFEEALADFLCELNLCRYAIRNLATIDVKNDEEGLLHFAGNNRWPIDFFRRDEINAVTADVDISSAALKAVGAIGVAEPTALLSANSTLLLGRKRKWQNITMAVAQAPFSLSAQVRDHWNT